ncbi:hypothetical protein BpHYR1_004546 [Brachionus plicatilis]|uniref:Uncharacterized protein n=1 Tax=Brachionus plicatilis TaxID=10195 RepID=A0A3M7Q6E1_BRAPC|nr:hypothetical protein BpHYR1_004546 [Brachionus plicatilis]
MNPDRQVSLQQNIAVKITGEEVQIIFLLFTNVMCIQKLLFVLPYKSYSFSIILKLKKELHLLIINPKFHIGTR